MKFEQVDILWNEEQKSIFLSAFFWLKWVFKFYPRFLHIFWRKAYSIRDPEVKAEWKNGVEDLQKN